MLFAGASKSLFTKPCSILDHIIKSIVIHVNISQDLLLCLNVWGSYNGSLVIVEDLKNTCSQITVLVTLFISVQRQDNLTLSQTSPGFYVSAVRVFRKHCGKRRNCSLTSNFSFSHSVFYLFGELSTIFIELKIVVFKLFQFGRLKNLSFLKGISQRLVLLKDKKHLIYPHTPEGCLTLSQTTNFRLF